MCTATSNFKRKNNLTCLLECIYLGQKLHTNTHACGSALNLHERIGWRKYECTVFATLSFLLLSSLYLSLPVSYISKVISPLHRHSHNLGPLCAFTRTRRGTVHSFHSCKWNKCSLPQPYNYCSSLLNIIWRCIKPRARGSLQARRWHPVCQ